MSNNGHQIVHHVLLNWPQFSHEAQLAGLAELNLERTVAQIHELAAFHCAPVHLGVAVHYHDVEGMNMLRRSGLARLIAVDRDGREAAATLSIEFEDRVIADQERAHVTMAGAHDTLVPMLRRLTAHRIPVRLLGAAPTPSPNVQSLGLPYQQLFAILGGERRPEVVVLMDSENIVISLEKGGVGATIGQIVGAVRNVVRAYGQEKLYFTCFDPRGVPNGLDVARALDEQNVVVELVSARPGKSSSDHRIVSKAYTLMAEAKSPKVVILVAGDGDYRELVHELRNRDKTVVVIGVRSATSKLLGLNANELLYLDDLLQEQRGAATARQDDGQRAARAAERGPELDAELDLALVFMAECQTRGTSWLSRGLLVERLAPERLGKAAREEAHRRITGAVAAGLLVSKMRSNPNPNAVRQMMESLELSPDHPAAQRARLLDERAHHVVSNILSTHAFAGFGLVAENLGRDPELNRVGLARSHDEQMALLNRLVDLGRLHKERRGGPRPTTALLLPSKPQAQDDEGRMRLRVIVRCLALAAHAGNGLVPLKTLHQQLRPFGEATFHGIVDGLIAAGEASKRQHASPTSPFPVTALHLNPEAPAIAIVRAEVRAVAAALAEGPAPQAALEAAIAPERATDLLEVLADEQLIGQRGQEWTLNRRHPLAADEPAAIEPVVDFGELRERLREWLSDDELTALAHDYFPSVHSRFTDGMAKTGKIQLLLAYVRQHGEVEHLLERAARCNPRFIGYSARYAG